MALPSMRADSRVYGLDLWRRESELLGLVRLTAQLLICEVAT